MSTKIFLLIALIGISSLALLYPLLSMRNRRTQDLPQALQAWHALLGPERVKDLQDTAMPDIGGYKDRNIPACLQPTTLEEVQQIVAIANQYQVPLYAFSRGKNWGIGSQKPVQDGCVLVDLHGMNQILEVNTSLRYMVIEPGVSQQQVAKRLKETDMIASFGGGGTTISLVGNVLDRGTGLFGSREGDILALEVVLGNGKTIRTGLWNLHDESTDPPFAHCYAPGLGADLKGLFIQSNLGIVTKMVIRLVPKTHRTIFRIIHKGNAKGIISPIIQLKEQGVIDNGQKITPPTEVNLYYPGQAKKGWECIGTLSGPPKVRAVKEQALQAAFPDQAQTTITFEKSEKHTDKEPQGWLEDHVKKCLGNSSDNHVANLLKIGGGTPGGGVNQLDHGLDAHPSMGFMAMNVVVPAQVEQVDRFISAVRAVSAHPNLFHPDITVGLGDLHHHAFKGHIGVLFNRCDPETVKKVHAFRVALYRNLRKEGFYPQRLSIDDMEWCQADQNATWQTIAALKKTLDPNGILSPGRYLWQQP